MEEKREQISNIFELHNKKIQQERMKQDDRNNLV